jgi:tetratricopeptide (TPR) repeat protein
VPAESDFVYPRLVHAIGLGEPESREAAFRFLSTAPDAAVYEQTRFVATLTRDFGAARRIADYLGDPARPAIVRGHAPILAAFLELASGRWAAARRALRAAAPILPAVAMEYQGLFATLPFLPYDESELARIRSLLASWDAAAVPPGSHPYPAFDLHREIHPVLRLFFLGALSARLGDPSAHDYARELEAIPVSTDAEALARDLAHGVRARALWREGDARAALAALERARWRPRQIMVVLQSPFYSLTSERWLKAELLRELGRLEEAARWYRTISQASTYDLIYLAPSQLRLGQIHQELGDLHRAAGHYRQFTELWAACDAELRPLVAEAGGRLARLPRPGRTSSPASRARVG